MVQQLELDPYQGKIDNKGDGNDRLSKSLTDTAARGLCIRPKEAWHLWHELFISRVYGTGNNQAKA